MAKVKAKTPKKTVNTKVTPKKPAPEKSGIQQVSNPASKTMGRGNPSGINIAVPSGYSEPSKNLEDYCILIYGDSGSGKTSLANRFEGCVTVELEPKREGLRIRKVPINYVSILSYRDTGRRPWLELLSFMDNALEDDSVQCIAIDIVSLAFEACKDQICWDRGIDHPNEADDFGSTWGVIPQSFRDIMSTFRREGKGLIFVEHATSEKIEDGVRVYYRTQPTLSETKTGAFKVIKEMTDLILYESVLDDGERHIQIRPSNKIFCKCDIDDHFLTPDGEPLLGFKAGRSVDETFDRLHQAFNNELHTDKAEGKGVIPRKKPDSKKKKR